MDLNNLIKEWEKDAEIGPDYEEESKKVDKLHQKYYKQLIAEKMLYRILNTEMKELVAKKTDFYKNGPNEETNKLGWEHPGTIIKAQTLLDKYIEGDKDVTTLQLKIDHQMEKIEFIMSILETIKYRGNRIKTAVDWHKFTHGA